MDNYSINSLCRLCLDRHGVLHIHLVIGLPENIVFFMGIKLKSDDGFPQSICMKCFRVLKNTEELRTLAQKNEQRLKSSICYSEQKKQDELEKKELEKSSTVDIYKKDIQVIEENLSTKIDSDIDIAETIEEINIPSTDTAKSESDDVASTSSHKLSVRTDLFIPSISKLPLTKAETQKRYRDRLRAENVEKYNEALKRHAERNRNHRKKQNEKRRDKNEKKRKQKQKARELKCIEEKDSINNTPKDLQHAMKEADEMENTEDLEEIPFIKIEKNPDILETSSEEIITPPTVNVKIEPDEVQKGISKETFDDLLENPNPEVKIKIEITGLDEQESQDSDDQPLKKRIKTNSDSSNKGAKKIKKEVEQIFNCKICGKVYTDKKKFFFHNKYHIKDYVCPMEGCEKKFSYRTDLEKHVRVHTGERPYECPVCFKKFTQRGTLKNHLINVHQVENEKKNVKLNNKPKVNKVSESENS